MATRRTKGEGTLQRLPDGKWRARITIDGETFERERTSREAAVAALEELREHSALGTKPGKWTVEAWVDHWIENIDDHDAKTQEGYRALLAPAVLPAIGKLRLDKVKPEHIERLYKTMRNGTHRKPKTRADGTTETVKPLAESSILKIHRVLNRAFRVAMQRGHTIRNPLDYVTPPKKGRPRTASFSTDTASRVLKQAIADGEGARWALSIMRGLRPGEALGLSWDCVDGDRIHVQQQLQHMTGVGVVLKEFTKTEEGMRTLDLPSIIVDLLAEQRQRQLEWMVEEGDDWETWTPPGNEHPKLMVFTDRRGHPIRPRLDATRWAQLLDRAGVPYQRPYVGRHTAASLMIANGVDAATVAAELGHTDSSFTMRTYVHPQQDARKAAARMMGDLFT